MLYDPRQFTLSLFALSTHKNTSLRRKPLKLLMIQLPVTFMQWHCCVQHKEMDHPSALEHNYATWPPRTKSAGAFFFYIKWLFSQTTIELSQSHTVWIPASINTRHKYHPLGCSTSCYLWLHIFHVSSGMWSAVKLMCHTFVKSLY